MSPNKPPRRPTSPDGFLAVDKPGGMTSHDVVAQLRRLTGTRRVGHGGTLDPMATGLLLCAVGRATRLLTFVTGAVKSYDATIRLGVGTITDDAEGEVTATPGYAISSGDGHPSSSCASGAKSQDRLAVQDGAAESPCPTDITAAIATLTGPIMQVPTTVSAIKVDGKRAYARARAGEDIELAARPVTVSEFRITDIRPGTMPDGTPVVDLDASVVVSAGTYVRALARDLGAALGTAGHLTMLRRTGVGEWTFAESHTLEQLEALAAEVNADGQGLPTIPMAQVAARFLPTRIVSDDESAALRQGQWIAASDNDAPTAALDAHGDLVAVIENVKRTGRTQAKPKIVL